MQHEDWLKSVVRDEADAVSAGLAEQPRWLNQFVPLGEDDGGSAGTGAEAEEPALLRGGVMVAAGSSAPKTGGWGGTGLMVLPLHVAAAAGALGVMRVLVEAGGAVECRTRHGSGLYGRETPMHLAASAGHAAVVAWLLGQKAGAAVLDADSAWPMHRAAAGGHAAVVGVLLGDAADDEPGTAQKAAPSAGLEEGNAGRGVRVGDVGLEARDGQGRTPLHVAIRGGFQGKGDSSGGPPTLDERGLRGVIAVVERLTAGGAEVDATCPKEADAFTALHRCVSQGEAWLPVAEGLVKAGADVTLRDPRHERTAGELAGMLGLVGYEALLGTRPAG
ncbi:MAG: ankyrin repeat domain-containing protein [Planctomycetota bacterium]